MSIIRKYEEEYYINMTIRSKGAYITQLGHVLPSKGYEWHKRSIARHFFDYVESGRGWVEYGGQRYAVGAGDLVFVKKGSAVNYGSDDDEPYAKLWCAADGDMVTAAAECYLGGREFLIVRGWNPEPLLRLKHVILSHGQDERRVTPLLIEMIMSIADLPVETDAEAAVPAERLKAYLDTHVTEKLSLDLLAEKFHLSGRHLSRIFKEHTGMTPGAYQCEQRLQAAARYLTETELSVGAIAAELGYCDQSFFSTAFKKHFGVYPLAWREMHG